MTEAPPPAGRAPAGGAPARSRADVGMPPPLLVEGARRAVAAGAPDRARAEALALVRTLLQPVVNATGVLLHTNLGRAPLAHTQAGSYTNLELDLATGDRGSRSSHAAALMARAAGAEAGLVVNNGRRGAAGAGRPGPRPERGGEPGELVEIGGGFRVPEVMVESGARLVEVGTTNRTRLDDYARAVADAAADPAADIALVMKVHQSNYRIEGFTEAVGVAGLAGLGPPVVVDLGSGLLDAACPWLAGGRPVAARRARRPPDHRRRRIAGDLLGRQAARRTPGRDHRRPGRPGGGLRATRWPERCARARSCSARCKRWPSPTSTGAPATSRSGGWPPPRSTSCGPGPSVAGADARLTVVEVDSVTGGGTLPGVEIPSAGVAVPGDHTTALRAHDPPVIARVVDGRTVCDLRRVDPADDARVANALERLPG